MPIIYVSPTGSSRNTGASASSALPITSLDKAIQLAGPGGTVYMLADKGAYNVTTGITLTHGGSTGAPVTIMGVDSYGHPENIQINGTRPTTYSSTTAASGNETFRLLSGANNLVFENMNFSNVASAFRVGANVSNITVQDMSANNVRIFFEDYVSGTNTSATIAGLTIRDVSVTGFSKGAIRLQYDTHDVVIDNVFGDSRYEDGDGICEGVALQGTVHNVLISHTTMEHAIASGTYYNGDGFSSELGVYNVTYQDTLSVGNADGGYDLKSSNTILNNAVAEGNGRNFRLWSTATLNDCVGLDPHLFGGTTGGQEQIQLMKGSQVVVNGGEFVDSGSNTWVVMNDSGAGVATFNNTKFVYASGAHLINIATGVTGVSSTLANIVSSTGTSSVNGDSLLGIIGLSGVTSTAGVLSSTTSTTTTTSSTTSSTGSGTTTSATTSTTSPTTTSTSGSGGAGSSGTSGVIDVHHLIRHHATTTSATPTSSSVTNAAVVSSMAVSQTALHSGPGDHLIHMMDGVGGLDLAHFSYQHQAIEHFG